MQATNRFLQLIGGRTFLSLLAGLLPVVLLALFAFIQLVDVDQIGLSSGFSHPLMGFDHLLTMLAVGIWAAQLRGHAIWQLPLTFVGVMSLGGIAGAAGLEIPVVEGIILLSCAVFSVLITRRIRFSAKINVLLVAFFAFFHGYAHGQEISTSASLLSYTAGFMLATLLLHGAGILIAKLVVVAISGLFAILISTSSQAAMITVEQTPASHALQLVSSDGDGMSHLSLAGSLKMDDGGGGFLQSDTERGSSSLTRSWQSLWSDPLRADFGQDLAEIKNQQQQEIEIVRHSFKTGFPAINHTPGLALACSGVGRASPPLENCSIALSLVSVPNSQIPRFLAVMTQFWRQQQSGFSATNSIPLIPNLQCKRNSCAQNFVLHFR